MEGYDNTQYFHLVATGKHRKQRIYRLEQEDGLIVGDAELKAYITNYYKGLFGPPEDNNFSMVENQNDDIPEVTEEENNFLVAPLTEREIKEAVFQMEHNKSPGPYGFPAEFYQVFREIIKADLMSLFMEFHEERLPIYSLNFGVITLLPKIKEATKIQQYRPICLLNVSFKISLRWLPIDSWEWLAKLCNLPKQRLCQDAI